MGHLNIALPEGWNVVGEKVLPGREARTVPARDLPLSQDTVEFLEEVTSSGIYAHQKLALQMLLEGKNVCLTTGTGSGKSLVFYTWAVETFERHPDAKVLAIYPLKALNQDQLKRWGEMLWDAGYSLDDADVIDGSVPRKERLFILENTRVLIMTPDVVHAWLLENLYRGEHLQAMENFLKNLRVVVLDEAHVYTGAFGTHAAFLFRRLRHAQRIVGGHAQWIAASATIDRPRSHMKNLTGLEFEIIDESQDTSPRYDLSLQMVVPPKPDITEIAKLMIHVVQHTDEKFILFADSRKLVESLATIAFRILRNMHEQDAELDARDSNDFLENFDILPYRSGYEAYDRKRIHERLQQGSLRGVISTSALELGIDIPHLTVGILLGLPRSSTSFLQRIGRIGRSSPGVVYIVQSGDTSSEMVRQCFDHLFALPPVQGVFYLGNKHVQLMHAICLNDAGRDGPGEHKTLCDYKGLDAHSFSTEISWPDEFVAICNGKSLPREVDQYVQEILNRSDTTPHRTFPLRTIDYRFQIVYSTRHRKEPLGEIEGSKAVREAYPGAVYYHLAQPYRVIRVDHRKGEILVRRERYYRTEPMMYVRTYPNLAEPYKALIFGDLLIMEADASVRMVVTGFKETQGSREIRREYPLDDPKYPLQNYQYTFPTTGVFLYHPAFHELTPMAREALAWLLKESLLTVVPYESYEIGFAAGKFKYVENERLALSDGDPFVAVFDNVYGGLKLTSKLTNREILEKVLLVASQGKGDKGLGCLNLSEGWKGDHQWAVHVSQVQDILSTLQSALQSHVQPEMVSTYDRFHEMGIAQDTTTRVLVLCPGQTGFVNGIVPFIVESVFYHPSKGLCYKGRYVEQPGRKIVLPVDQLTFSHDQQTGVYNIEDGSLDGCDNLKDE